MIGILVLELLNKEFYKQLWSSWAAWSKRLSRKKLNIHHTLFMSLVLNDYQRGMIWHYFFQWAVAPEIPSLFISVHLSTVRLRREVSVPGSIWWAELSRTHGRQVEPPGLSPWADHQRRQRSCLSGLDHFSNYVIYYFNRHLQVTDSTKIA